MDHALGGAFQGGEIPFGRVVNGSTGNDHLHTDDVRNIPDRILNMLETRVDADRLENDIYQAMDVGVLIRKKKNGAGQVYRYIDQVCFFDREGQKTKLLWQ